MASEPVTVTPSAGTNASTVLHGTAVAAMSYTNQKYLGVLLPLMVVPAQLKVMVPVGLAMARPTWLAGENAVVVVMYNRAAVTFDAVVLTIVKLIPVTVFVGLPFPFDT